MRQIVTCDAPRSALRGDAGTVGYILLRDGRSQVGVINQLPLEPTRWRLGFGWDQHSMFSPNPTGGSFKFECSVVAVPYWSLLALMAVLPALWCRRRWVRDRRQKMGLCLACGYDLRGSPDRCPECGAEAKSRPAEGAIA
jgi:hypothetical protein